MSGSELTITIVKRDVTYYINNVSNSAFVEHLSDGFVRWYLMTTTTSHCHVCKIETRDVLAWSHDSSYRDVIHANLVCARCTKYCGNIEWPSTRIHYHNRDHAYMISLTVSLTLVEMVTNLKTTPPGIFCYSCRVTIVECDSTVCSCCAAHLRQFVLAWYMIRLLCDHVLVPRDVAKYTLYLITQ